MAYHDIQRILALYGWSSTSEAVTGNLGFCYVAHLSKKPSMHVHVYSEKTISDYYKLPKISLQDCVSGLTSAMSSLYGFGRIGLSDKQKEVLLDKCCYVALNYFVQTNNFAINYGSFDRTVHMILIAVPSGKSGYLFRPFPVAGNSQLPLEPSQVYELANSYALMRGDISA